MISRLLGDVRHVAVGAASPIPATAALLARARHRHAGRPYVSLLGSREHNFFTDGARELFDCAGQGRIDVFFLSGGQIDGAGQHQPGGVGDSDRPRVRFPGSFGSAYLYYVVPRVILFRVEHSRRTLVPQVDFISAPGTSAGRVTGPAGRWRWSPTAACSPSTAGAAAFGWTACIPGTACEEIENTGFDFDLPDAVPPTPAPSARRCVSCARWWRRCWLRSIRSSPKGCLELRPRHRYPEARAKRASKDATPALIGTAISK